MYVCGGENKKGVGEERNKKKKKKKGLNKLFFNLFVMWKFVSASLWYFLWYNFVCYNFYW